MQLATRSVKDCQDDGDYCTKVIIVVGDETEGSKGKTAVVADPLSRPVERRFRYHTTASRGVMKKVNQHSLARIHSQRQLR